MTSNLSWLNKETMLRELGDIVVINDSKATITRPRQIMKITIHANSRKSFFIEKMSCNASSHIESISYLTPRDAKQVTKADLNVARKQYLFF